MKKWLYYRLTGIRDSLLCPVWLESLIDDARYSDVFKEFWDYE